MAAREGNGSGRRWPGVLATAAAVLVLFAMLVAPNHLGRLTPAAFARLPVELAVLAGILALAWGRTGRIVEAVLALSVALALVLKIGDMAAFEAFARPFNPVLDAHLLAAAMNLLTGSIGQAGALAAAAGAVLAVIVVLIAAGWAVRRTGRLVRRLPTSTALALAGAGGLAWGLLHVAGVETRPRTAAAAIESARAIETHTRSAVASLDDLAEFKTIAAVDAWRDAPDDRLLTALSGKDVIVAFIESYGRTVLDDPRYAGRLGPVLTEGTERLARGGIGARSAYLTSPTVGGMSWLAHGTALSGVWVDNQRRYESLVVSNRMTLNQAFRRAGWRTVAVMPAITMAWPEGSYYGYDAIYASTDLGYRGKPFNWVTMPDQYTWSALRRLELDRADRRPVMAELALISSHAPWTPVPRLVPWSAVGDGSVFNEMATSGDPPEVVWRDGDRVRVQFREATAYALETLVDYAATFDMRDTVIIALGDHQPAPLITGEDAGRDVPVHILSADPAVLDAIKGWGWSAGMLPADNAPVWRMDALRDRLIEAYSEPPTSGVADRPRNESGEGGASGG